MNDFRTLRPGQRCRIRVASIEDSALRTVYESDQILLEAPNWTLDGESLILNGNGHLWRLTLATANLEQIPLEGVPTLNNDHVLSPDGENIYVSANDGHIYRASLSGGVVHRVTHDVSMLHFLHGVSPDGATLAFVGLEIDQDFRPIRADIGTIPADGGEAAMLTNSPYPDDGPEFSPDGEWMYFNTEQFSTTPGHAQIARMRPDGSAVEQLTFDRHVNWFPHIAPSGASAIYLRFPAGTHGHPADQDVSIQLVRGADWHATTTVVELTGGQGTVNVNSWAPTGDQFAFVEYLMPGT